MTENQLAWEVFQSALDQWNMNGGYDFWLAVELFRSFGCEGGELIEEISRIRVMVVELRAIWEATRLQDESREKFLADQRSQGLLK